MWYDLLQDPLTRLFDLEVSQDIMSSVHSLQELAAVATSELCCSRFNLTVKHSRISTLKLRFSSGAITTTGLYNTFLQVRHCFISNIHIVFTDRTCQSIVASPYDITIVNHLLSMLSDRGKLHYYSVTDRAGNVVELYKDPRIRFYRRQISNTVFHGGSNAKDD